MEAMHVIAELRRPGSILNNLLNSPRDNEWQQKDLSLFSSDGSIAELSGLDAMCFGRSRLLVSLSEAQKRKHPRPNDKANEPGNRDTASREIVSERIKFPFSKRRNVYGNGNSEDIIVPESTSETGPSVRIGAYKRGRKRHQSGRPTLDNEFDDNDLDIDSDVLQHRSRIRNARKSDMGVDEIIQIGNHKVSFNWNKKCQEISEVSSIVHTILIIVILNGLIL
jgi:hypothetical protein